MSTGLNSKERNRTEDASLLKVYLNEDKYRWVNLFLLWFLYVAFGLISRAIAPLVTPILQDLQLSYAQMGFILGSWQLTYIGVAMLAGSLIDNWGVRKSLMAGTIVMGLSSVLRYFPRGFEGMLAAVALFGAGGSMISIGIPKAIFLWFQGKSRGTAVGFSLTGSWIGGIFALTCTNSLVMPWMGHSWRYCLALYGFLTFAIALLWWFFVRDTEIRPGAQEAGIIKVFYKLIRVRNVQIALISGFLFFTVLHGFSNWLPKILETSGFSRALSGIMAAIPLAAGIPALLIIPHLIPAASRGRCLAVLAFLTIITLAMSVATSGVAQLIGLALFGFITSPLLSILTLILMDTSDVGPESMGSAVGLFYCASEIGGVTGPLMIGVLKDVTGGFLAGTIFLAVLCLVIAILTLFLKT